MMTEQSPFMMGFVIITENENCIVVDGGRPEDMPQLLESIGGRPVKAWILTHPHVDHISGIARLALEGLPENIENVYCDFPSAEYIRRYEPWEAYTIEEFETAAPKFGDKLKKAVAGQTLHIDNVDVSFLFVGGERFFSPRPNVAVNESSLVTRISGEGIKNVLFLGDLGPEGGKKLLEEFGSGLKSDIVQMAHHGHSGVNRDVYEAIAPEECLWCAPEWLWNEEDIEWEPGLFGTLHQRKWMEELGVKKNWVSKDGIQTIVLDK